MKIFGLFCGMNIIVLVSADFKSDCLAINSESEKRSIYYRGRCIVAREPAAKPSYNTAKSMCNDMKKRMFKGHLIHLQDAENTKAVIDLFPLALNNEYYIGLVQSNDSAGIEKHWYWIDENAGLKWSADTSLHNQWDSAEPNNANHGGGVYEDCGCMKPTVVNKLNCIRDTPCQNYVRWFMCQYHNPTTQYKRWHEINKVGNTTTWIESPTVNGKADCSLMCHDTLICQAFAYNKQTNDCKLYWTSYQNDYPLEDGNGYDFYYLI